MEYLPVLMSIAVVQLLGAANPGPTFVMVSSYAIGGSRRHGLLAFMGFDGRRRPRKRSLSIS